MGEGKRENVFKSEFPGERERDRETSNMNTSLILFSEKKGRDFVFVQKIFFPFLYLKMKMC